MRPLLRLILATLLLAASPLHAQVRVFPPNTKVGVLQMGYYPQARINGDDVRFSPGARILDQGNRVVLPASLTDAVRIRYRIDPQGQIGQAWILTDDEIAQSRGR